ncbi:UDP-forming cellulose synthase catalytic subunit [Methylobacterium sp. E-025]|uniref:UDP-forming cellulose synthase catalytic subunit n=1 Tax=Methylobacterium sp. E-025 TaxID=2836561 RepID=UPI001FBB694F|nr:UDP-forming cellulose synthase catalytic subunit [Methylobacterium sp. E-025]MCJ2114751.1 UDP-forming cellulose synthase catalytic subunit [Methylobacterium sp. E-025]
MTSVLVRAVWLVSAAVVLLLLAQPVGTSIQLEMSLGAIGLMILLWLFARGQVGRSVFLAVGSLIVLRYLYWRLSSTLPPTTDPFGFAAGVTLALAEVYCFYILMVSLIVNADPLTRALVPADDDADLPTVDIFVPSYNEDRHILATTLAAARSLDYPAGKLTVWLLDDGGTDQKCTDSDLAAAQEARTRRADLQTLCAELGVSYLTRRRNLHAKAGNLNNGLQNSGGEVVVVLDADHVPFRSFLRDTVGHFAEDPKLFLVQTPHAFLNPDPVERNLATFDRMPSENEMFYAIGQRGLDKWNGSFFCGSAALLRRTALEEAGGFSGVTITEDCETAFELHSRGWTSVYVDKTLIAGLQPATLSDFIGQRSRWCQGMLQIMLLKNPMFKRGLKPIQRLCYLSSMTFWFFPIPRLIFMIAPLLYIFLDMKIVIANVDEAVAYTATYILVNLMMQNYLYGRVRWPFVSELYEYVQGLFLIRATAAVILSPRRPQFKVTAKNVTLDRDQLSPLALPFFLVFAVLLTGCCVASYRYLFEPGVTNLMLVVGLWNGFNLITAGAALGVAAERRQTETSPSLAVDRRAVLTLNGMAVDVAVERISSAGCQVRMDAVVPMQRSTDTNAGLLSVPPRAGLSAEAVRAAIPVRLTAMTAAGEESVWRLDFETLPPEAYFVLADLMYGDADAMARFQQRRRGHKNLLAGILQFVWWGVVGPVRAAAYLLKGNPAPVPAAAPQVEVPLPRTVTMHRRLVDGARAEPAANVGSSEITVRSPKPVPKVEDATPGWLQMMLDAENAALVRDRRRNSDSPHPSAG